MLRATLPSLFALTCLTAAVRADIVVLDGDSLVDAVAAAEDGETIFIQGEGPFHGSLSWSGKSITIRQGFGFGKPTIVGDPGEPALDYKPSQAGSGGRLSGLILVGGAGANRALNAIGQGGEVSDLELEGCEIDGSSNFAALSDGLLDYRFENCVFGGMINILGQGSVQHSLRFDACDLRSMSLTPSGQATLVVELYDSTLTRETTIHEFAGSAISFTARRCRFEDYLACIGNDDGQGRLLLESCLHLGPGSLISNREGIRVQDGIEARGVNLTVTGFETGIFGEPGASWSNLLLYGNEQDLSPVVLPFQIDHSLISDGTYAGQGGNIAGAPLLNEDYALLSVSPGVDAGDSLAADIGALDAYGDPRIQDGDADGSAQTSVGAVETSELLPFAAVAPLPSNAINPEWLLSEPAIVGDEFTAKVETDVNTTLSLVAIGTPSAPSGLPGISGELLLDLSQPLIFDLALGNHDFDVPDNLSLYGAQVGIQALRVDQASGLTTLTATNGLLMTLGA